MAVRVLGRALVLIVLFTLVAGVAAVASPALAVVGSQGDVLEIRSLTRPRVVNNFGDCSYTDQVWTGQQFMYCAHVNVWDAQLGSRYPPSTNQQSDVTWDACGNKVLQGTRSGFNGGQTFNGLAGSNAYTVPTVASECYGDWKVEYTFTQTFSNGTTLTDTYVTTFPVYESAPGLQPPIPLKQTFGMGGCNCNGASQGYQHLTELPVNTATGALTELFADVELPGPGTPFVFSRAYTSLDTTPGPMGPGWTHPFNASLSVGATGNVTVRAEDGQQVRYTLLADGSFRTPPGARSQLTATAGGYRLTKPDQSTLDFDTSGRLTAVRNRVGQGLTLGYTNGHLSTITDSAFREISLSYSAAGLLTSVALPDGRQVGYGYTNGYLTSVTDLRGKVTTYAYDAGNRLESARDPLGHYLFRNTYDPATGRVVEQLDARGKKTLFGWDPTTGTATTTDPRGGQWVEVYENNVLLQRTNPLGHTTRYAYDKQLNLTKITDPRGNLTTMTYDGSRNMLTRTAPAPLSYQESWTYNASNDVLTYTDGRRNTAITNTYYPTTRLLETSTDAEGGVTKYTYTPKGQGETVTDSRLKVTKFGYDADGNLDLITTPSGATTTMDYDASGRLVSVVDPRGNVAGGVPADYTTTYGYNNADQVASRTDAKKYTTTFGYDDAGNLKTTTDAKLKTTGHGYDEANNLTTVTDPTGAITGYGYDDTGNLASITTPAGTTTHEYDLAGRLKKTIDPRGNVTGASPAPYTWTYDYDDNGNQTKVSNPAAGTTITDYDELNRPYQVTDPLTNVTAIGYDPNSNIKTVTDPSNAVTTYDYDKTNRLISIIDARGKTTKIGYDPAGNRTSHTTPLGNKTTWTYHADGQLASEVDPRGNETGATPSKYTTTYGYDPAGHLTTLVDANGNETLTEGDGTTIYSHDPVGNLLSARDANDHTTTYGYDELHRLTSVTAPGASQATRYAYDDAGNLITRTDNMDRVTTYGYDAAHRLTSRTSPIGQKWTYDYDPAGNLTNVIDANGHATLTEGDGTTAYSYDSRNLLTGIDYSSGTVSDVTYGHDFAGNRTSMTDRFGTETYTYNTRNLLTNVTRGTSVFAYRYTATQQIDRVTYPDGTVVRYCHDDDDRIESVTEGTTSCPATDATDTAYYTYTAAGGVKATTLPSGNGHVETRTYDRNQWLTRVRNANGTAVLSDSRYTLDGVGNPTMMTVDDGTTTSTTSYKYNVRDRLTEVCFQASCPNASDPYIRYGYDGVGNRTTQTRPAGTTTYSYNGADQLTAQAGPDGSATYNYDDNGNLTYASDLFDYPGDSFTFDYDGANRMVMATIKPWYVDERYRYDGNGNRAQIEDDNGKITNHQWDINAPLPRLVSENADDGSVERRYIHGHRLISMDTPAANAKHFYHHDRLGSVLNLTGNNGTRRWSYTYEPSGELRDVTKHTNSAQPNPMKFTGEYFDGHTATYHLRARQYHPKTGRFTATDPLAPPLDDPYVSAYVYANNQPTVLTDPSGLYPTDGLDGNTHNHNVDLQYMGEYGMHAWDYIEGTGPESIPFRWRDLAGGFGQGFADLADLTTPLARYGYGPSELATQINSCLGVNTRSSWYEAGLYAPDLAAILGTGGAAAGLRAARLAPTVARAAKTAPAVSQILMRSPGQLQSKFKHAGDFGVNGNYSKANAANFSSAMHQHMNAAGTQRIVGTYRNSPAAHYLDPKSGLNVVSDLDGNFITGFRLGSGQLNDVLTSGRLW